MDPASGSSQAAALCSTSRQVFLARPSYEELLTPDLCNQEDAVRADITFFEGPNGRADLACSSILFANSLEEDDGGGRLASNALRRFLDPLPFRLPPGAESNLEESAGGSAAVPPSVDNHGKQNG